MAPTIELLNDLRLANFGVAELYECPPVRIVEDGANITAANDIRLLISATTAMTWDTSIVTVTIFMTGTGVVATGGVTYANLDKTAVINVTTNFAAGDRVVIVGLRFNSQNSTEKGTTIGLAWDGTPTPGASTANIFTIGVGDTGPSLSAANHFAYKVGDVTPALPTLTIKGDSSATFTAANDLRLHIRNTSAFGTAPKWDTTMTSVTLGGNAAAKASATLSAASFQNNDRTLIIDLTSTLVATDVLTISGLRFATIPAATTYALDCLEAVGNGTNAPATTDVDGVDDKFYAVGPPDITMAAIATIAPSAVSQTIGKITITDTLGVIKANDDLRLIILNTTSLTRNVDTTAYGRNNLTFDNVTPVFTGAASGRMVGSLVRVDSNRMLVLSVNSDFIAGDVLTIDGLKISNSIATATKLYVGLIIESAADDSATGAFGPVVSLVTEFNLMPDPVVPPGPQGLIKRDQIETSGAGAVSEIPVGTIVPFAGGLTPVGYFSCNGQAINRTTYAALFAAIGTTYGPGDGSSTFNIPDTRGRTPIGSGTGVGLTPRARGDIGGEESHILTIAEMANHNHLMTSITNTSQDGPGNSRVNNSTGAFSTATGGGGAHNNMQPFLALNFMIRT